MARKYPLKDVKILFGFAAGRCSYPGYQINVVLSGNDRDSAAVIGKIAHIYAHADRGPRGNADLLERDCYENWILLCGTHHDTIDKRSNTYSADKLFRWKQDHEKWVDGKLSEGMSSFSFVELEKTVKGILGDGGVSTESLGLTPPREKIAKNELSSRIADRISMGMVKSGDVGDFVKGMSKLDPEFPEKLSFGFVKQYNRFLEEGLKSDALFEALHRYAVSGCQGFDEEAAGLAVLVYLFELCEIFER